MERGKRVVTSCEVETSIRCYQMVLVSPLMNCLTNLLTRPIHKFSHMLSKPRSYSLPPPIQTRWKVKHVLDPAVLRVELSIHHRCNYCVVDRS